jgi:autophagy-related protein 18
LPSPTTPFSAVPPTSTAPAAGATVGDVLLFDAISLSVTNVIQAHKTPLAAIAFNAHGTLLATASDKGTVIRVFSLPDGDKVAEFRRGSYPSRIFSLAFNAVSSLLCVSSASDTVHIFKMPKPGSTNGPRRAGLSRNPSDYADDDNAASTASLARHSGREGSAGGYEAFIDSKRSPMGCVTPVLQTDFPSTHAQDTAEEVAHPRSVRRRQRRRLPPRRRDSDVGAATGLCLPQAAGAGREEHCRTQWVRPLPCGTLRTLITGAASSTPQVFVVTSEGTLYTYHLDLEVGGECVLQKSYKCVKRVR